MSRGPNLSENKRRSIVMRARKGFSDALIAEALDVSERSVRHVRAQAGLCRKRGPNRAGGAAPFSSAAMFVGDGRETVATSQALAERDRAYDAPRTIDQLLLGDPLPGRSYLDRMRARQ